MNVQKGDTLKFSTRAEVVIKANNDTKKGSIKTGNNTYSTGFINQWLSIGLVTLVKNVNNS